MKQTVDLTDLLPHLGPQEALVLCEWVRRIEMLLNDLYDLVGQDKVSVNVRVELNADAIPLPQTEK